MCPSPTLHASPLLSFPAQPTSRRNEVLGWVKEGVRDFSISRSAVSWGIPMAQDPEHTVYVWFDALNGYLSGLLPLPDAAPAAGSNGGSDGSGGGSSVERALQQGWPADVHVIGKDILRFHAIYWPGMLMAAGLPLPKQVGAQRRREGGREQAWDGSCGCGGQIWTY